MRERMRGLFDGGGGGGQTPTSSLVCGVLARAPASLRLGGTVANREKTLALLIVYHFFHRYLYICGSVSVPRGWAKVVVVVVVVHPMGWSAGA